VSASRTSGICSGGCSSSIRSGFHGVEVERVAGDLRLGPERDHLDHRVVQHLVLVVEQVAVHRLLVRLEGRQHDALGDLPAVVAANRCAYGVQRARQILHVVGIGPCEPELTHLHGQRRIGNRILVLGRE
jgi:hypothetical protein